MLGVVVATMARTGKTWAARRDQTDSRMTPLDIAVAGAGPAGLAAALALGSQGHRVVVFDQFDTPKPLGSGLILQPTGLAVLD